MKALDAHVDEFENAYVLMDNANATSYNYFNPGYITDGYIGETP
jgi:hypothetical protein